jgi:hypothetical protein
MRLLETCTTAWKMDTVIQQINALREAFSADVSKPFELKPDFPFGSPQAQTAELPLMSPHMNFAAHTQQESAFATGQVSFALANPLTPPRSTTTEDDMRADSSPIHQPHVSLAGHHPSTNSAPALVQSQWNPSRIWE